MSKRRVVLIAAGFSLLYLLIQTVYIWRLPLVMDEFDGANEAYQLLDLTPYKDYRPYKTVLGYYLQLPPLLLTSDPWTGLMLSKIWLALINAVAIFVSTLALASIFSPPAALTGQLLLISVTTFLERSSEIRVDMLTAWFGLASFLLLLKRRWFVAGVLAGASFLVSQKGIYYIVAANAAAGIFWLFESRDRRTVSHLVMMNVAVASVIAVYIAFWGVFSTPSSVFSAIFLSHGNIVFTQMYDLEQHWWRTFGRNPLFYWGAVAGIVALVFARWRERVGSAHLITAAYASVLFALCRWHKQPWPYFFVLLIPTLMVVHVAIAEIVWRRPRWRTIAGVAVVLLGIGWPLTYMPGILERDHAYQRDVVRLSHAMLDQNDTYLAGNDILYDRHQAHSALRRLSAYQIEAMKQWAPERFAALIAELERERPKLVIDDSRMRRLPVPLRTYFASRFDRLSLSVNGYSPAIGSDEKHFELWFDGDYRVEPADGDAEIDGLRIAPGSVLTLQRGSHRNDSASTIRLRLLTHRVAVDNAGARIGRRPMFARAYDY